VNTAQVIAQQLAALGIRVSIKLVDWPTWISEVYTARRYQATVISIDGVTLSPRSYLFRYETGEARNFINYSNPRFDDFYRRSLVAADEEARTALYKDMQRVLSDDAASVFICDISSAKAFRKGIKGFQQYPLYVFDASTLYMEEKTP
jgi:peptide/nickel transport system substrate-binding protein